MYCDNRYELGPALGNNQVCSGVIDPKTSVDGKYKASLAENARRCATSPVKRTLDVVLAGFALFALSPLFALVSLGLLAQRDGPILFVQERTGLHGRVFRILKFRTMRHGDRNTPFEQTSGKNDARVTKLGRWLRRSSIDELPQLVNVLRGDMSLVGPRPHPTDLDRELEKADARYPLRLLVRPGLTGLAQISNARGPIAAGSTLDRRLTLDLEYVHRWSSLADLKLLMRTGKYLIVSNGDAF